MANTDGKGKSFEKYWDENDVKTGLERGTLFEVCNTILNCNIFCKPYFFYWKGVVRINPKNYKEAYVTAPVSENLFEYFVSY